MGSHPLGFTAIVILPNLAIAAALIHLVRRAYTSAHPARPLLLYPLVAAFIATIAFVGWGQYSIFTSRSSTAAIGLIFLPFISVGVAFFGFLVSGAILYVCRFAFERMVGLAPRLTSVAPLVAALLILFCTGYAIQGYLARHQLLVSVKSSTSSPAVLDQAIAVHDLEILAAAARNKNTSEADLLRIFDVCKDKVGVANAKEYVVLNALAGNSKTPPAVLTALAQCPEVSIRVALGTNPSTPVEILPLLAHDKEALVRTWVTVNPKIPKELLLKLAEDGDKTVQSYAHSSLLRRGSSETPEDPVIENMTNLGRRAASGELKAVDEIEDQRRQLYEGIDFTKDRPKVISNLHLMRAAFDVIGKEAANSAEAMKALEYANGKKALRSFTVDAFGLAATGGNQQAMDALLNYKANGWLLSSTVSAMKHPARENQPQAIDFLIQVLDDPKDKGLHSMARLGLEGAAAKGNEMAKAALTKRPD